MGAPRASGGAPRRGAPPAARRLAAALTLMCASAAAVAAVARDGGGSIAPSARIPRKRGAGCGCDFGAARRRRRRLPPPALRIGDDVGAADLGAASALASASVRGGAMGRRGSGGAEAAPARARAAAAAAEESSSSPPSLPPPPPPPRWFPVRPSELPSFAALSSLMFLFIYVFTTVRDTKDTLLVSHCGAESIPLLKLLGVTPAAAAFLVVYGRAASVLGRDALFHATLLPFFAFYALFGFVLYPLRETIHFPPPPPSAAAAAAEGVAAAAEAAEAAAAGGSGGAAGRAALLLLRYWSYSLYFVVSELWASAGVPLLFWQVANDVTPLDRAKTFYPLFAVFGNLAPVLSGRVMGYVVSRNTDDDVGFGSTLRALAAVKLAVCAAIIALHRVVYAMADRRAGEEETSSLEPRPEPKRRGKATLAESTRELSRNPALRSMAAMVVCYNMCVELTEVLWKALLRKSRPTKSSYMSFMASFSQTVGYVALILQLCASAVIRTLGWRTSASLTPFAMGILAVPFFGAVALGEGRGVPPSAALLIGTAQNVVSKVTKYSLFDPCKEMAYIPLGPDARVRGKAAVDVLGARLGRGLGSAGLQLLVFAAGEGSVLGCAPALGVLYGAAVGVWMRAVSALAGAFDGDGAPASGEGEGEGDGSAGAAARAAGATTFQSKKKKKKKASRSD